MVSGLNVGADPLACNPEASWLPSDNECIGLRNAFSTLFTCNGKFMNLLKRKEDTYN